MKLRIVHETRYSYDSPVRYSAQYLRLTPRDTARQRVISWELETPGQPVRTQDGFGNILHVLTLDKPVSEIVIRARGAVETSRTADEPSDFTGITLSPLLFLRATALTRADGKLKELARKLGPRAATLDGLRGLADALRAQQPGDSAENLTHAFIAACRLNGLPARYVSGYLRLDTGPGGVTPHCWAEAWVEERWRSFDIVQGTAIGDAHVKLAMGADHLDACPIRGMRTGGGVETMIAKAQIAQ
jgi:transglutaminase-like putative cysteine protease